MLKRRDLIAAAAFAVLATPAWAQDAVDVAKAKAEGKYKGRPANIDAAEIKRLAATMGPAAIAKELGIARSSVYRLIG